MNYMVEIVAIKDREVVRRVGPMNERKADKVERALLMRIDDDKYFVQTVEVTNAEENTDFMDTQDDA